MGLRCHVRVGRGRGNTRHGSAGVTVAGASPQAVTVAGAPSLPREKAGRHGEVTVHLGGFTLFLEEGELCAMWSERRCDAGMGMGRHILSLMSVLILRERIIDTIYIYIYIYTYIPFSHCK